MGEGGSGHGKAYLSSLILNKVKEKKITDRGYSAPELLELRKTFKLKMKQPIITWPVRTWKGCRCGWSKCPESREAE